MKSARVVLTAFLAAAVLQGCGDDGSKIVNPTPTPTPTLSAVQVTPSTLQLEEGETFQLTATPVDQDGEAMDVAVTWSSADEAVATVDADGLVTAVVEGQAEILAEADGDDGTVTGKAALSVIRPGEVVPVAGGTVTYLDGAVVLEIPDGALAEPTKITIRPSGADVAGEQPGMVGSTSYQFRPEGLLFQKQARLTIRYETGNVPAGVRQERLSLYHRTQTGWAEVTGSEVDTAARTVSGPVESFSHYGVKESGRAQVDRVVVEGATGEPLVVGAALQLTATPYGSDGSALQGREISWTSSNEAAVGVDPEGLVTARAPGDATITATSEGVSGSVSLTVSGGATASEGNNLSYPTIMAEGLGPGGTDVSEEDGLRPGPEEDVAVDALPFFWAGNEPDYGAYYLQQGANVWQAEWADGRSVSWPRQVAVSWSDDVTGTMWNTHAPIRVENSLRAEGAAPMKGYAMTHLYGQDPDEMQGTDGSVYEATPEVYSVLPRMTLEKLSGEDPNGEPGTPVCKVYDGAIHESVGAEGPNRYSSEVDVTGRIVYGFTFTIRDVTMCSPELHKYGWWRLTFRLDDQGTAGGTTVHRDMDLVGIVPSGGSGGNRLYTPQFDPAGQTSWLDIYIVSAKGGGGE